MEPVLQPVDNFAWQLINNCLEENVWQRSISIAKTALSPQMSVQGVDPIFFIPARIESASKGISVLVIRFT